MKHHERLEKLRQKQQQLTATIREAEAVASTLQQKKELRAKIILGSAILTMPNGEREALLPMFMERMTGRDRTFVSELLTDEQPEQPPSSDIPQAD